MKALIVGASGQLGSELARSAPAGVTLACRTEAELDIKDRAAVFRAVTTERPAILFNAAAYTAVDAAESNREAAFAVNATGAESVALAGREVGARVVHVSTDFVFSGEANRPYRPDDTTAPLGVYGESKLAGEQLVLAATAGRALVVRTSWLYSSHGHNFVKTMLRLMRERDHLRVISDQVGTPTWARGLATALWSLARAPDAAGVQHWSDAGVASWYDFAVAIAEEALSLGLLERAVAVEPIRTEDYPTPARRPAYSVLDKTSTWEILGAKSPHWRAGLRGVLGELAAESGR